MGYIWIDPAGSDGNGIGASMAAAEAAPIQSASRANALITANAGPHTLVYSGIFHRGITGWAPTTGFMHQMNQANAQGITILSGDTASATGNPGIICDFKISTSTGDWTDTTTTTTDGTKIWVATDVVTTGGYHVRRLFGANWLTDSNFNDKELWEGGANYTSTFTNIHPNLDVVPGDNVHGNCWTNWDSSGTLTRNLYIACPINPVTMYGAITYITDEVAACLGLAGLSGVTIDPALELWGGGQKTLDLFQIGATGVESHIAPAIKYTHAYGQPIMIDSATRALTIYPYVRPMYSREVPYYPAASTGHSVGSNQIMIDDTCNMSSATGYSFNGDIHGVKFAAIASNGRRSRIEDLFHCGIGNLAPATANYHQYIEIEDGIEFDFSHVKYGRAWAFNGAAANCHDIIIGNILVENQPTQCQPSASHIYILGGRYRSKKSIGDGYVSPWGTTSNKAGTAVPISIESVNAGVPMGHVYLIDADLEGEDGAFKIDCLASSFNGPIVVANSKLIRTARPYWTQSVMGNVPRAIGISVPENTSLGFINLINLTNIGWDSSGTSVRFFRTTPSANNGQTLEGVLPTTQNFGWTHYTDIGQFLLAAKGLPNLP